MERPHCFGNIPDALRLLGSPGKAWRSIARFQLGTSVAPIEQIVSILPIVPIVAHRHIDRTCQISF